MIRVRATIIYTDSEPMLLVYAVVDEELHVLALEPLSKFLATA